MKLTCPDPFIYAVIRMDPVAMVEHFKDPEATARARAMVTKKYLFYTEAVLDLPFITNSWFRFIASPIATTLRDPDPEKHYTPDMCVPIFPNTDHPTGRPAVRSERLFPFPHCYHWIDTNTIIRVRQKPGGYDDSTVIELSPEEHVALTNRFSDDYVRISRLLRKQDESAQVASGTLPLDAARPGSSSLPQDLCAECSTGAHSESHAYPLPGSIGSDSDTSGPDTPEPDAGDSLEGLLRMDIFGLGHDDAAELYPLVDLWFELTDHLTADTIPAPSEFFKERDAVVQ
ncbi:hypothetical protein C8Q77DRAFT_1065328 [Trametes polyzona]|nr:hypothetical protein C8Q77DRAFT_1065328 [Trametes polyzona]